MASAQAFNIAPSPAWCASKEALQHAPQAQEEQAGGAAVQQEALHPASSGLLGQRVCIRRHVGGTQQGRKQAQHQHDRGAAGRPPAGAQHGRHGRERRQQHGCRAGREEAGSALPISCSRSCAGRRHTLWKLNHTQPACHPPASCSRLPGTAAHAAQAPTAVARSAA